MSNTDLPDDGLMQPVDPTHGGPKPTPMSAAAAQKANQVEGAEETSLRPDFDAAEALRRRAGEW
jgi:hypothetical protein